MRDKQTRGPGYRVGDRIIYRGAFGTAKPTVATITGLGTKNGQPLVDLDDGHWAYLDQIDSLACEVR